MAGGMTAHRYGWERENGPVPDGMHLDHRYHCDRACCEVSHLRLATRDENRRNLSGPSRNNALGVRNVYFRRGRFQVCVRSRGRAYGRTHRTLEAAQAEAAELREHLFGEFAGKG